MDEWIKLALVVFGSVGGGYLGVRVAVARLESQMSDVREEIRLLREAKHDHAGMLTQHELRITNLERE